MRVCLDATPTAPTLVTNKTNLRKGDIVVISLDKDETQQIVMQVDDERSGPSTDPGISFNDELYLNFYS